MEYLNLLQYAYAGNTVRQYLISFGFIFGSIILGKLLSLIIKGHIRKIAENTKTMLDDVLVNSIDKPLVFFVFAWGIYAGIKYLILPSNVETFSVNLVKILFTIAVAWFIIRFIDQVILHYLVPLTQKTESDIDDHLVPFVRKFVKAFIFVIAGIMIIGDLGYNVTSLITGLGIGGLAVALAAQSTLGNVIGGLNIIWDKPFRIGDRIKIDKFDGTVREIGMRSTKIETIDGTLVSVPNQVISTTSLENLSKVEGVSNEPVRRVVAAIGLTYGTSVKKIREAEELIKKIVAKTKGTDGNCRVHFKAFGDSSLVLEAVWWVKDLNRQPETINEVNLGIKESLEKENIEMAFPTRTLHIKK